MNSFNISQVQNVTDRSLLVAVCLTIIFLLVLFDNQNSSSQTSPAFEVPELEKQAFIKNVRMLVKKENRKVKYNQALLSKLTSTADSNDFHSSSNSRKLSLLAAKFGLEHFDRVTDLDRLERRVNIIPSSLIVSIAILESNWGTSVPSKQTNNLFENTCRNSFCYQNSKSASLGSNSGRKLQKYSSIEKSVESLFKTINVSDNFSPLRNARAGFKRRGQLFDGLKLLPSLEHSELFSKSVLIELRKIIEENNLE